MSRHALRSSPKRPLARLSFLARVALGVIVLMFAPTIAQAAFTNAESAAVSVGTYAIPAPASISGTQNCAGNRRSLSVTINDFGAVARATGYTVTLTAPSGQTSTVELGPNTRSTTISRTSQRSGTYTLRISADVGTWTGQNLERLLTC